MNKQIAIIAALGILGLSRSSYSLTTEWIGPSTQHPAAARPDWPAGFIKIPKHISRVYSTCGGFGNEDFYFNCKVDEINELLAVFSKARMRDHVVRIEPGIEKVTAFFNKEEIEYNVHLEIVSGIALDLARGDRSGKARPLEPQLTILTGDDKSLVKKLKWPENLIVESKIRGVSINRNRKKPKREVYYGLCEFTDGSPPAKSVKVVNNPITLWDQTERNGSGIGRIDNNGYFTILLSKKELADLRKCTIWLTITIGGWQVEARRCDTRFPAEMLTKDRRKARPVKVAAPASYYGRILFEDDSCPILDQPPWPGAQIQVGFLDGAITTIEPDGYFEVSMTKEQYQQLEAQETRPNIYIPDPGRKGRRSTAKYVYPAHLLSQDIYEACVVRIRRPKYPEKELATGDQE